MHLKKKARPLFAALLAAVLMLALLPLPAYAANDYTFDEQSGLLTIYTNNGTSAWRNQTSVNIFKVKTVVVEAGVTEIASGAFWNCTGLTSVTLPDSLEKIGKEAFRTCSTLQSLTIPPNVTSIGEDVFMSCVKLESVTLPNNLTEIGARAFAYCTALPSVTIPPKVTSIGYMMFEACHSLTSVTLPDSLTEIGERAFDECYALPSVTIPPNVTSIGARAFDECYALQSLTIPPKVTSIGAWAFDDCSSLTTLTFQGQTPPSLGQGVFERLGITTINVPYGATGYDGGDWGSLPIIHAAAPPPTPAAPAPAAEGVPHVCYFGDWQYSDEHHWKRCSCMALSDYAPHVFNGARVCTVCGYGAKAKKVNPQTSVYDSGLPQSFSKPLLFHFAPLIGA